MLALAAWKVPELMRTMVRRLQASKPVKMPRGVKAAEVAKVAVRHFKGLDWCHTREGTKVHLRGCRILRETDEVIEQATSRRRGSEGRPHEVISRTLCYWCAVRLDESLRIELESTD